MVPNRGGSRRPVGERSPSAVNSMLMLIISYSSVLSYSVYCVFIGYVFAFGYYCGRTISFLALHYHYMGVARCT